MSRALLLALSLVLSAGCRKPPCEELEPAPVAGSYRGSGMLGRERMLKVGVTASGKAVVLTYTAMDGTRIRAKYRVTKKKKLP